jgi:hypothetical protein
MGVTRAKDEVCPHRPSSGCSGSCASCAFADQSNHVPSEDLPGSSGHFETLTTQQIAHPASLSESLANTGVGGFTIEKYQDVAVRAFPRVAVAESSCPVSKGGAAPLTLDLH